MNRLQFYFKAQTAHGLHSPSIYALYIEILNPYLHGQLSYPALLDALRVRYSASKIIEIQDDLNLAKVEEDTILLLKQPYKNEAFWNSLKANPRVIQTVDLFDLGIVFFKPICPKQNFYLRKM
jgi:hypothetical protein